MSDADQRNLAHARLMIGQMSANAKSAKWSSEQASAAGRLGRVHHIVASNTMAAFGLELGLKAIYKAFKATNQPTTHKLNGLYKGLPSQIQNDLSLNYATGVAETGDIISVALIQSETSPKTPSQSSGKRYGNAEDFFKSVDRLFVFSRYFHEKVSQNQWAIIEHPVEQMLLMSSIVEQAFLHYVEHGWATEPK